MGFGGVVGAIGLGLQAHQTHEGIRSQKRALGLQDRAQEQAKTAASSERIRTQTDLNKANRKKPDVAALLANAKKDGQTGVNSTFLSGSGAFGQLGGAG